MIDAVKNGRKNTAMNSFATILDLNEMGAVVDFIQQEFMLDKALNTKYHIKENGWDSHEQYKAAFPFALGEIPIDTPGEKLTKEQLVGKRIFMNSCITCHDRASVINEGVIWDSRAVSYPRNQYSHKTKSRNLKNDTVSSATSYAKHDIAPKVENLTAKQALGEQLFQQNCAFCHAADGTGKNWIGSFLEPHPRNLTDPEFMDSVDTKSLRKVIENGLPGTTMSAWKNVLKKEEISAVIAYIEHVFKP